MPFRRLITLAAASLSVSFALAGSALAQTVVGDWSGAYVGASAGASFGQ